MNHWQKLHPMDQYLVLSNGILHDQDRRVLTFLYQPLIGLEPFALYMTLWCELEENRLSSKEPTSHRDLMTLLGVSLSDLYLWRQKLEGVGLLKTFVKETNDHRLIIYELQPPETPEIFFNAGMLNIYLYRQIGEKQYTRLKKYFSDQLISKDGFTEETLPFEEVYTTISEETLHHSIQAEKKLASNEDRTLHGRATSPELLVHAESYIDLDFIIQSSSMIPKEAFTALVKRSIGIVAFIYGIDAVTMKNMVLDAFEPNTDAINVEELRMIARKWYQLQNDHKLPKLVDKIHSPLLSSLKAEPQTAEEEHYYYLETTSPRVALTDLAGGAAPSSADLKIIEDIMFNQKLEPGVMNVLIEYVMLKNDMQLSRAYIEKIASHWARKKLKTVKDAIEYARNQDKKYQEWSQAASQKPRNNKKKATRTEVIPEWFKKISDDQTTTDQQETDFDFEAEKRKLEEELKQFEKER